MDVPDDEPRDTTTVHDLADVQDPGRIERVEGDGGTVRYRNILMLAPGVWGDAGSGRHIYYSPEGIENSADNWEETTVNLFHERENEVTDVGNVDESSVFLGEDGGLYGDIVLHLENPASSFADAALQNALETDGKEGLQGPSVELRGEDYRFNEERGTHELVEGTFTGLGLVGLGVSPGPGSKDAAFAEQTRDRAVALAGDDDAPLLTLQDHDMKIDTEHVIAQLAERGIDVGDDPDEETLTTLAEAFDIELQEDEEGDENEDPPDDEEESGDGGGDEEPDEEDEEMDLSDVADRVKENSEAIGELSEQVMAIAEATEALQADDGIDLADLAESVESIGDTIDALAEAETVDDIESRLSAIEDEPEEPTSLADAGEDVELTHASGEKVRVEMGPNAPQKPAFTK